MEATVIVERHHRSGVVLVRLNRPEQHNALNAQLVRELSQTFRSLSAEKQYRVVVLTGNGRSFCAGADLQEVMASGQAGRDVAQEDGRRLHDMMTAISLCPMPVIGRVNGWALGGGMGLACCCDLVVASDRARFGFSEVRLGLIPAVITPFVLSRIHITEARELYLTGERFNADRAREIGLVDRVTGDEDLDQAVDEWVDMLLQGAPGAQGAIKALLKEIASLGQERQREYTSGLFAQRVVSEEGREGMQAFLEKRRAAWREDDT